MTGIFLLLISITAGYIMISPVASKLFNRQGVICLSGKSARLPRFMVVLPASVLSGILLFTWCSYIFSYIFRSTSRPLLYGNMAAGIAISGFIILYAAKHGFFEKIKGFPDRIRDLWSAGFWSSCRLELLYIFIVSSFWSYFMYRSFHVDGDTIKVGISVFSDFAPHLALIRSFSFGTNLPAEYPHFADGTIRYHFLFQFLAGNLEFSGLRLDHAFNIPSIACMISFLMLLYSFSVMVTGKRWAGILTALLFHFRSSFAFFTFMNKQENLGALLKRVFALTGHIGNTTHEEWGLWAQKVFVNQRHLAAGLGILLFSLMLMTPYLRDMLKSLKNKTLKGWFNDVFVKSDSWIPQDILPSITAGLLLGLTGFVNGAAVVAALSILFVMALFSKQRLAFLNIALIAVILVLIQTTFFMGSSKTLSPRLTVGFLAKGTDAVSISRFYTELLGVLPLVLLAGILTSHRRLTRYAVLAVPAAALYYIFWPAPDFPLPYKIIILLIVSLAAFASFHYRTGTRPFSAPLLLVIFAAPVACATLLQLTPDITMNHKYVITGVMLLNIIAASFLYGLFSSGRPLGIASALLLSLLLTVTGFADIKTLYNLDKNHIHIKTDDPLIIWAREITDPDDVFLTPAYSLHPLLLSGRKIFYGWPYYAWSAGYDTNYRKTVVKRIYSAASAQTLRNLVSKHGISYIVVENDNRNSSDYKLNEALIEQTFVEVYSKGGYRIFSTD